MFGWRKKRDGFEWHEYVRTTILLRRANRRRKIDDVRDAAVDGLKGARRAAAAGLDNAKVAAAAGLHNVAGKGASAGSSGLQAAITAVSALVRRIAAGASAGLGSLMRLPATLWQASTRGAGATAGGAGGALRALGDRISATRIGAASTAMPLGALGVALLIGAAARFASHGFDATTIVIAIGALVCLALVVLPALANADGRPRDQIIKDRGGRPSRSDYSPSDDITHAHPLLPRQATGMLVWGSLGALAVLGLGPLLSPDTGTQSRDASSNIVTSSITPREAASGALEGHASALGGDTLRISGRIVRLAGIEAPEGEQSCTREGGTRWQCGEAAQRALERITRRDTLTCTITEVRTDGPSLASCRTTAGTDIASELVRAGHAFADDGFFAAYSAQQEEARSGKKGIWSGSAQRPAEYRTARWEEARKAAPDGCPIKGQVSGRSRTYVLPWTPGYDRIKVRDTRGGRWFCSEDEARAAGWQPAQRS